ncbi:hypothetical protein BDV93DRAFT_610717 [Ceratobasidium sp. AG-I]|nr:hypothetical protein BDV93DRAFT_610717 [Ceratobasidium sp. AG-I]
MSELIENGLPLEEYLIKYQRGEDTWQPWTTPATVEQARATIIAIRRKKPVSTLLLEPIISLTHHPQALYLLYNPNLLHDCIWLLSRLQTQEPQSAFSHESGYLLLQIVSFAIGVGILKRTVNYSFVIKAMQENERREDLTFMFTDYVSSGICARLDDQTSLLDSFLGWERIRIYEPLMSQADALLLLDILYKGRKAFFRAWLDTRAPELTGLLCVLWRVVRLNSTQDRWIKLGEIHWRYYILGGTGHELMQRAINRDVMKYYQAWRDRSTVVDLEDSRTILRAYIGRMTSAPVTHPLTDAVTVVDMLAFAIPNIKPGVEDQLIPVIRVSLDFFWLIVSGDAPLKNFVLEIEDIVGLILSINKIFGHLNAHNLALAKQAALATADLGLIELICHGYFIVNKWGSINVGNLDLHPLFRESHLLITALLGTGPSAFCEVTYANAFQDWFKTLQYIRARDGMFNTNLRKQSWYQTGERVLVEIGDVLEYDVRVPDAEAMSRGWHIRGVLTRIRSAL